MACYYDLMQYIVGLGNPGKKYENTRHNIGFVVLDALTEYIGAAFEENKKCNALIARGILNGQDAMLIKPLTYMNRSGQAVSALVKFYKQQPDKIIVIHDELDIQFGSVKVSEGRGSAGNKGVESILQHIKDVPLLRVRVGIGNKALDRRRRIIPKKAKDLAVGDFVLSKFSFTERFKLKRIINDVMKNVINVL